MLGPMNRKLYQAVLQSLQRGSRGFSTANKGDFFCSWCLVLLVHDMPTASSDLQASPAKPQAPTSC